MYLPRFWDKRLTREAFYAELRLLVAVIPGGIGSHDGMITALVSGSDDVQG